MVRRPQLLVREGLWIALLGPSIGEGIVGVGHTVANALRAFDTQSSAGLRTPPNTLGNQRTFVFPTSRIEP